MARARYELRSYEFRKERESTWRRLEQLVRKVERSGLRSLDARELAELPVLYRATLSSLSVARSISLDRNLLEFLESLAARAYFCVYGSKRSAYEAILGFVMFDFPHAIRSSSGGIALSTLFFVGGGLTGFFAVLAEPEFYYAFVDGALSDGRNPTASTEFLREGLFDGSEEESSGLAAFAAYLFSHNSQIGILAFATGVLAGLPVFLLLFTNGLMLGAFAALYHDRGLSVELWSWLLPHGVTELASLVLCGAAGLLLAHAWIFPGRLSRLESLRQHGRRAGILVVGCIGMDLIAALFEGFFRQQVQSIGVRYLTAALVAAFWIYYIGWVGRSRSGRVDGRRGLPDQAAAEPRP